VIHDDSRIFAELEQRLRTLLPEEYQDRYDDVQPVSMGTAGVRYGPGGRIAWDQMWGSFCDLAIAGGPPHKGALLLPGTPDEIAANRDRYEAVVAEICRGIRMVTDLVAAPSPASGWVRIECETRGMAGWLVRAISMENVAVRTDGVFLELPAGSGYRDLKEIKNVITVVAKTVHYWSGHMPVIQRQSIADLIEGMNEESPLVAPDYSASASALAHGSARLAEGIVRETGLRVDGVNGAWLGVECPSVRAAVWMMRMLVTVNVLARREDAVLFVPIDSAVDPDGEIVVVSSLALVHRLARAKGVLTNAGGGNA
jgi:sirohydrochlorin cobaltochelatase